MEESEGLQSMDCKESDTTEWLTQIHAEMEIAELAQDRLLRVTTGCTNQHHICWPYSRLWSFALKAQWFTLVRIWSVVELILCNWNSYTVLASIWQNWFTLKQNKTTQPKNLKQAVSMWNRTSFHSPSGKLNQNLKMMLVRKQSKLNECRWWA